MDEKAQWIDYCKQAGRADDLVIIEPGNGQVFNFLEFITTTQDGNYSTNVVNVLNTVIRGGRDTESSREDSFWQEALTLTVSNVVDLCILAYGKVTVQLLYDIFLSAPKKEDDKAKESSDDDNAFKEAFRLARRKINAEIEAWEKTMPEGWVQEMEALGLAEKARMKAIPGARTLMSVYNFFIEKYKSLAEKTKSIIDFKFMGFLYRLLQEPVYSLFCEGESTVTPADCLDGKIILLNLPIQQYGQVGKDAQILFKYIWQKTMERRDIGANERPVLNFADEAHYTVISEDALFQTTCRSSRIATIYITQNLSNYYAQMGGDASEHHVHSLIATLATKVFHANSDVITNKFASDLIGEEWVEDRSQTSTLVGDLHMSNTKSYKLQKLVRPEMFQRLLTGGAVNNYRTGAYIQTQGRPFNNGRNYQKISFNQKFHL